MEINNPAPHWIRTRSFVMLNGVKLANMGDDRHIHPETGEEFENPNTRLSHQGGMLRLRPCCTAPGINKCARDTA